MNKEVFSGLKVQMYINKFNLESVIDIQTLLSNSATKRLDTGKVWK